MITERQKALAEAEEFLKRYGIFKHVEELLDSPEVQEQIAEAIAEMLTEVKSYKEMAPEELKERAEELYKGFDGIEKLFKEEVAVAFKMKAYVAFSMMPEYIFQLGNLFGVTEKIFQQPDGRAIHLNELNKIIKAEESKLVNEYIESLFDGYVPSDLPEEVVDFIQEITGGCTIIPFSAIFREHDSDNKTEE